MRKDIGLRVKGESVRMRARTDEIWEWKGAGRYEVCGGNEDWNACSEGLVKCLDGAFLHKQLFIDDHLFWLIGGFSR